MAEDAARDGLQVVQLPGARMRVPARYDVVRGEEGRVVLQPAPPATGVVWITVITAEPPAGKEGAGMGEIVRAKAAEVGKEAQELEDGRVLVSFDDLAEEEGQRLVVRTVHIGIEKTLGIVQAVIPEADLQETANRVLVADLARMVMTFEPAERTELVETPTGTVATKVTQMEGGGEAQRREFGPLEKGQVEEFVAFGEGLVGKYAAFTKEITPKLLDTVFNRWMQDADREKADGESVSLAIGTLFGECMCRKLGMHWAVVSDEQGEAWALVHPGTTMMAFPVESVRKRVEARETNFLHGLAQVIENHLKEGRFARPAEGAE
jgi:hypothetical protein